MGTKILQAALALHEKVAGTFRKTAVNFHYEFTVRHLANVFQGLLMSTPEQFNNVTKLSRLWLHESERVYADRLVSAAVCPSPADPRLLVFKCACTSKAMHLLSTVMQQAGLSCETVSWTWDTQQY